MKKSLLLLPLFLLAAICNLSAQNDAITRFFEKYVDDERFTVVYVSPKMFQLVSKIETSDEDWNKVRDIVKDLGGLRVLAADSIDDGLKYYKDALSKVPAGEYEELLTVRDGKEHVRIWVKDASNIIEELLLLVGAPDEFVMLSFTGKIDLDKISALSKTLDIDGAKHLEKVKPGKDVKVKIDTEDDKN
ncbi:MAG: DUF4252 domain-containing protein [Haliscomenobacteraceae bacterium CHB4]|nr:hypothetical protein [Saprospiraceae bacterium]MCE7926852.1 DUF4252 domain-containing protein [Haliscomenobacteraceae bacterium CHB4]